MYDVSNHNMAAKSGEGGGHQGISGACGDRGRAGPTAVCSVLKAHRCAHWSVAVGLLKATMMRRACMKLVH